MIDDVRIFCHPDYPHAHAFDEVGAAFSEATICGPQTGRCLYFGLHAANHDMHHLCPVGKDDMHHLCPVGKDDIVYQTEQVNPECQWMTPDYLETLRTHEVWDYSDRNVENLAKLGVKAKLVPIRYMPCMTKNFPTVEQDIDVLFYGSMNPRRKAILHKLERTGLNVRTVFGKYGAERDALIARSKVILNVHYYERGIFEIFRCSHLFANKKCVVSEWGIDDDLDRRHTWSAVFALPSELVDACEQFVHDDWLREQQEQSAFESFKTPTLADELRVNIK